MNEVQNNKSDNKRWWDFYLIRYFIGTLLGCIVFYLIINKFRYPDGTKNDDSILGTNFNDVFEVIIEPGSTIGLLVILFGGMLFSYISSGPILILHASRLGLRFGQLSKRKMKFNSAGLMLIILFGSFLGVLVYQLIEISPWVALINLIALVPFLLFIYLWCSDGNSSEETKLDELCYKIVKKRSAENEFPQTYRHLREHGNAFFIVFTEILLGGSLYFASSSSDILVILSCWIIPPLFMWFFANYLEGYLMKLK